MSEGPNYDALLADIDAKIAKLQAARETIVEIMAMSGGSPSGPGPGGKIAHDAFLQMSIPDAAKKYLGMSRKKQNTQAIIEALEQGGLPRSAYNTVYAVLRRREKQTGDIINMQGDWALPEWYPNYKKKAATEEEEANTAAEANGKETKAEAKSA